MGVMDGGGILARCPSPPDGVVKGLKGLRGIAAQRIIAPVLATTARASVAQRYGKSSGATTKVTPGAYARRRPALRRLDQGSKRSPS